MKSCIITSASNKFFPSVLNLIGSIKANYPQHPPLFLYNLGLLPSYIKELKEVHGVTVLEVPHFVSHWRSCYTWKTYVLNTPLADLNFYIDAGSEVVKPLDEIFEAIETDGYFAIEQNSPLAMNLPQEYRSIFSVDEPLCSLPLLTAGIVGFKKDSFVSPLMRELYDAGIAGLCLGFSPKEQWKNKGVNKNIFIRNCEMFRHDTTLFTIIMRKHIANLKVHSVKKYANDALTIDPSSDTVIRNFRMNYKKLSYATPTFFINKILMGMFLNMKALNRLIKRLP
jgi:hypothetical protein